jgi:ABC-type phosphate transport system substrate-binding protein
MAGLLVRSALAEPAAAFRVIVNPRNLTGSVDRKFLAQAFLKKTTQWPSGDVIKPVDLAADSPLRRAFVEEVLGRSVAAVKSYWQQMIFSGRGVPPPELESEEAVIRYVLRTPGAVGYVSAGADLHGARALPVR